MSGQKQKTEVKGSKQKDQGKIFKEEERQCSVGGERFSEGFSEAAIGEADKCRH